MCLRLKPKVVVSRALGYEGAVSQKTMVRKLDDYFFEIVVELYLNKKMNKEIRFKVPPDAKQVDVKVNYNEVAATYFTVTEKRLSGYSSIPFKVTDIEILDGQE